MIGKTLSHYCIVEKIGAGGMGEVYRARDEHLGRDVAIKVLPAGTLADEQARKRFRKEAQALSKLNHPNIATVHDFDTQDGTDFLVMELVEGVTLSDKLAVGPLGEKEITRLGAQLAEGLAAAHEQRVVHRDLKPANLRVTPDGRLKILDFGLAKLVRPDVASATATTESFTETQGMAGTLPYMAPEQLRGEQVDARTDIYAAGAALYEMATGQRAFPETQTGRLMDAILHRAPQPPSGLNRRVSPVLESIILKALDKEPERRYQSAKELRVDLERLGAPVPLVAVRRPRVLPRWWVLGGGLAAVVGVLAVLLALNVGGSWERLLDRASPGRTQPGAPITLEFRRSVAVLGFKNLSRRPDAAWLSTALSEMLATELAAGEKLRIIPGENVARMKIELSLADADSFAKDTLARIRTNLGTDLVVFGSYIALGKETGDQIRLDLRLQDAAAGKTIASLAETGTEAELFDLVSRAGSHLRKKLGVGELSAAEVGGVRVSLPSNAEAARFYSEGLAKLRHFDPLAARDLLRKAIAVEPGHPLAHSALAAAWSALGYDANAKEEAKKAFELSANLTREERLSVEGRYRETAREWRKAVEIYRTLWVFFPDNLDYGLRLVAAQSTAGMGEDALATVEALRKLPPAASEDPRIDITEAQAAESLSDFKRERVAAARAAQKGEVRGARLLVAMARLQEGWAFRNLGEFDKAKNSYVEARQIFAAAGNRLGVARAIHNIAVVLADQGDFAGAEKMYKEALAISREIGNKLGEAWALNNIAILLWEQGNLARAKKMYEDALAIEREIGDKSGVATGLNNIANVLADQGDLAGAKKMYEEALAIERGIGDKRGVALVRKNIADVLTQQGSLAGARMIYEEALAIFREIGDKRMSAQSLYDLGGLLAAEGDLTGARKRHEEALAIRNELGAKGAAAESRLALARLSLEEERFAEAEVVAREVAEEFRREKATVDEGQAYVVLARCLLAQSKFAEAQKAIYRSTVLLHSSDNRNARLTMAITSARVFAASNKPIEAVKSLRATIEEATKAGFAGLQLEARLALGEIELQSSRSAGGRTRLEALEREATARGFGLIARKAAATLRSRP